MQFLHLEAVAMRQGNSPAASILVVGGEPQGQPWLAAVLREDGHAVTLASGVRETAERLQGHAYTLVISDLELPDGDGLQVLGMIHQRQPAAAFLLLIRSGAMASAVEALHRGALDFLEKPFRSPNDVRLAVRRAITLARETDEKPREAGGPRATPGLCGSMVARDPRMLHVLNLLGKVAPTSANVLLIGETGVGKEVIARCIHLHSRRASAPFIAVHCLALGPGLVESELFGHERGAFAGAVARRHGALERARGGTVFLDGIADLPPAAQAKLLRALRNGSFHRIGGTQAIEIDVRIIAAADRSLEALAGGGFDPDLLALLGAFPMEIPPLRDRPADIDALADQFVAAAAAKFGKPELHLSQAARFLLRSHSWPGNVRELENAIERAAILSDGEIRPDHLPFGPPQTVDPAFAGTLNVHELERIAIEEALRRHGGNRTRAARELGISLRTLQYRLKEFGLSRS